MLKIEMTTAIKRDLKRYKHHEEVLLELEEVIKLLVRKKDLPTKYQDHNLKDNWKNHRECHVKNDVLLIYKTSEDALFLTRFGSHSELF